jgi:hypothetical protein
VTVKSAEMVGITPDGVTTLTNNPRRIWMQS